jgi:hypothetical protein
MDLYYFSLLDPFNVVNAKAPSYLSLPTSCIKVKFKYNIVTNASGNAAFGFLPVLTLSTGATSDHGFFYVNNEADLTGTADNNGFLAKRTDMNMVIDLFA